MKSTWAAVAAAIALASPSTGAQSPAPAFNLTGTWNSAGGGVAQFFQDGNRLTVLFVTPEFAHRVRAAYSDPTRAVGFQSRVTRATGCKTQARVTYTVVSADYATVEGVALDSHCDLTKGQIFTDAITRIF